MRLTISFEQDERILTVDVPTDMKLMDLKAYIGAEMDLAPQHMTLGYKNAVMAEDSRTLEEWQLSDGDLIMVSVEAIGSVTGSTVFEQRSRIGASVEASREGGNVATSSSGGGGGNEMDRLYADVERVRLQLQNDPILRQGVSQTYPELVQVVDEPLQFRELMIKIEKGRVEAENIKRQELKRLQDDPFNEESQQKILEIIQQEAVMENLNRALEHNPEVFGQVSMLFVDVLVNGHPLKAFVDSGAQVTIMSPSCVEACNLTHLVDKRFSGVAHGVGTARILGRVHSAPIRVGNSYLPCSFTVMEGKKVDLLLGLDMLKRHQGVVDLRRNVLVLGDSEVPFLSDADIPESFRDVVTDGKGVSVQEDNKLQQRQQLQQQQERQQQQQQKQLEANVASTSNPYRNGVPTSSQPPLQGAPAPVRKPHPEELVQTLTALGFSRAEAEEALDSANGDVELAASMLIQ